jgi:hypothetical protein
MYERAATLSIFLYYQIFKFNIRFAGNLNVGHKKIRSMAADFRLIFLKILNYSLRQHGFGNFYKTSYVCPFYIVYPCTVFPVGYTSVVNILHNTF